MKQITSILFAGILAMSLLSCSSDDPVTPEPPIQPAFADQTQREHTLTNLVRAYNDKNADAVDDLLATDFVFFFGQADLDNGNVANPTWDRASETTATQNLFDPSLNTASEVQATSGQVAESTWGSIKSIYASPVPSLDPATTIALTITWQTGEDTWREIVAPSGSATPEVRYEKTVQYKLSVVAGETNYNNAQALAASLVIKQVDDGNGKMIYQIIQWRDDI